MRTKISVIIPIYNVEQYLAKCLDSVINQTYKNLEIICVNDCSPDNSAKILEEYSKKDDRIKIINRKENGGLSAARNSGMEIMTGEYVYFLDSDDWIDNNYIEELVSKMEEKNVDCVINLNVNNVYEDENNAPKMSEKIYKNTQGEYISAKDFFNNRKYLRWSVWSHLYKRTTIQEHNIIFPDGYINEDIYFEHFYKKYIDKIFVYFGSAYNYTIRNTSLTGKNNSLALSHIKIYNKLVELYKEHHWLDNNEFKFFDLTNFMNITKEDEFNSVKDFLHKYSKLIDSQINLYDDFEKFIRFTITSKDWNEFNIKYKNKLGFLFLRENIKNKAMVNV